jgi:hypothetical protein
MKWKMYGVTLKMMSSLFSDGDIGCYQQDGVEES